MKPVAPVRAIRGAFIEQPPDCGTGKAPENQADENDARGERRDLHRGRGPEECHSGEAGEGKVEPEHMGADLERRKAVVGGLLVEMAAMRLPHLLAARKAAQQGDGGVHQVIERQQDRSSERARSGQLQQHPADEKADRQRAHIAEEEPRDGLVERGEAEERAAEGEGDEAYAGSA